MAFRTYVAAGFGEPITKPWLELARKVATGVRQDIPNGLHAKAVNRLVEEVAKSGLNAIFLVGGWQWGDADGLNVHGNKDAHPTPQGVAASTAQVLWAAKHYGMEDRTIIEVGPELNIDPLYKRDLEPLRDICHAAWGAIWTHAPGTTMIAASVSNLAKNEGMKSLEKWLRDLPEQWWAGVHPYRTRGPSDEQPDTFSGYDSPESMLSRLKQILDGRPFAITEAGWHDGEQTYKSGPLNLCTKTSQYSRGEVATWARWDIEFWREAGAELYAWYQIRDGREDDPDSEAHFGAYLQDQTPKLVAATLAHESAA